jgi:hypothetical protein
MESTCLVCPAPWFPGQPRPEAPRSRLIERANRGLPCSPRPTCHCECSLYQSESGGQLHHRLLADEDGVPGEGTLQGGVDPRSAPQGGQACQSKLLRRFLPPRG